jgi:hypothetical protein
MTRRAPDFARAFAGRWRLTEMDEWDEIDLLGSAHITFSGKDGAAAMGIGAGNSRQIGSADRGIDVASAKRLISRYGAGEIIGYRRGNSRGSNAAEDADRRRGHQ